MQLSYAETGRKESLPVRSHVDRPGM